MIRRLARPLLGAALISSGLEAWQGIDRRTAHAERLGVPEPVRTTRAAAAIQMGGGALLVLNRMPRLVALALAATVIPEAVTGH
ncbi:MAG TPA: DoxX family protein, partial [Mycobacteriales bacterium]|nr:DoxX family protein [Mycobacteriales bacterium]